MGTWTAIPAFRVGGETPFIRAAGAREDGHVFVIYDRLADRAANLPADQVRVDVAEYAPDTGWRTFLSSNDVVMRNLIVMDVQGTRLVAWYQENYVNRAIHRGIYDTTSNTWTVTYPFMGWNPDLTPYAVGNSRAHTRDWMVFLGDTYDDGNTPRCSVSREGGLIVPFNDTTAVPGTLATNPLGARQGFPMVRAGERVFAFGGYRQYRGNGCARTPYYDGLFLDPATGTWSFLLAIPEPVGTRTYPEVRLLWMGDRVAIVDGLGEEDRIHTLVPGGTSYVTTDPPRAYVQGGFRPEFWASLNSVTGSSKGILMYNPERNAVMRFTIGAQSVDAVCAPPGPVGGLSYVGTSIAERALLQPHGNGAVLLGINGGGYLSLP